MLDDQFLDVLAEVGLQGNVVFDVVGFHERLDFGIRVPLLTVHLVSANVEILVGEKLRHFT